MASRKLSASACFLLVLQTAWSAKTANRVDNSIRPHIHQQRAHAHSTSRSFRATVSAVHLAKKVTLANQDSDVTTAKLFAEKESHNIETGTKKLDGSILQEFTTPPKDYSIRLNNHFNVQYSGRFTIGDQELPMIYDTGSFEVLVLSTKCTSCVKSLSMYDYKQSHSFRESPSHVVAEHAFVSGDVVTAEVSKLYDWVEETLLCRRMI